MERTTELTLRLTASQTANLREVANRKHLDFNAYVQRVLQHEADAELAIPDTHRRELGKAAADLLQVAVMLQAVKTEWTQSDRRNAGIEAKIGEVLTELRDCARILAAKAGAVDPEEDAA